MFVHPEAVGQRDGLSRPLRGASVNHRPATTIQTFFEVRMDHIMNKRITSGCRRVRRGVAGAFLVAALAVASVACGDTASTPTAPLPTPTTSSGYSTGNTYQPGPSYTGDYSSSSGYAGSGYNSYVPEEDEDYGSSGYSGDTDHCAFPGDYLCPNTPITIPAPDLGQYGW